MKDQNFKVGDVVVLKSGSNPMVISQIIENDKCLCIYFDETCSKIKYTQIFLPFLCFEHYNEKIIENEDQNFEVGDTVVLKSGSQRAVINSINKGFCHCIFFDYTCSKISFLSEQEDYEGAIDIRLLRKE